MVVAWTVLQSFWTMIWFFLFIMWLMLLFRVFADIFRAPDLSGGARAFWILFTILFPYLGVFVYLIARGEKMSRRELGDAQAQEDAVKQYIQQAAGTTQSTAQELERLAGLRDRGVIDNAEFDRLKARLVS